jgi:DNA-binding CsgD family transcriptional regulator
MELWTDSLTKTEKELLVLLSAGRTKRDAAAELQLSHHTLDSKLRRVFHKLKAHSMVEAVATALRERAIE